MTKEISVRELKKIMDDDKLKNSILVDVRTRPEHASMRIEGAVNIPLDQLESRKAELEKYDTIFLHCRSGGRSLQGCTILSDLKNTHVVNVGGGIIEWQSEGFAVKQKKGFSLPLIQQVHLTAGSLVLVGVILSFIHHPAWALLSGFVGAGLVFSGVTGWCGIVRLLSKMPWNR